MTIVREFLIHLEDHMYGIMSPYLQTKEIAFIIDGMVKVKRIESEKELSECMYIRRMSFIVEKNIPESIEVDSFDTYPSKMMHFLVLKEDMPVSTFRASIIENNTVKLQRICTLKEYRGKGYGKVAMDYAYDYFKNMGLKRLYLHSQEDSVGFYEKCGFKVISDMFLEADIPHYEMEKQL